MKKSIFAKIGLFLSSAGALLSTVVAFGAEPANDSAAPSVFEEMAIENGVMPTSIRQIIETITKNQGRPYFVNIESAEVMGRSLQAASSTYPFPRTVYLVSTKTPFATGGPAEFPFFVRLHAQRRKT